MPAPFEFCMETDAILSKFFEVTFWTSFHKTISCAPIGSLSDIIMPTTGSLNQDYGTMIFEINLNNFGSLLSAKFFHDQLSMLYLQNSGKKIENLLNVKVIYYWFKPMRDFCGNLYFAKRFVVILVVEL